MHFLPKLQQAWSLQDSLLTVGLDPDIHKFPQGVGRDLAGIYTFCQGIVTATAPYACAIKPQIAYFAALRAEEVLEDLCRWIQKEYPHLLLVLDAKRGDIGSTAEQYAREAFERYQADAVTINPYMGFDSAQPYLEWQDKGVFVLCRTSNKGGDDFQNLLVAEQPLYQQVARQVAEKWNRNAQCGLVVGATYPHEIAQVRAIVGDTMPLLIPGIGAQGGDVLATVTAGKTSAGTGMLINSSRAIIYASSGEDWSAAAAQAAAATQQAIQAAKKAASSDRF